MLNANEFFEIVGELYYGRFRRLRPGKSVSPFDDQAHENYEENVKRFKEWVDGPLAFNDAIEQIAKLQDKVRELEAALEETSVDHPCRHYDNPALCKICNPTPAQKNCEQGKT